MNRTHQNTALLIGLLSTASVAFADDTTSGHSGLESVAASHIEQQSTISPGLSFIGSSDFDNAANGDVSVSRFQLPYRYTAKSDSGTFGLGAYYERSSYDFSSLLDDQDFDTLALNAYWKAPIDDVWSYFILGGVSTSASTDATLSDGFTGFLGGGAIYTYSPTLSFGLGAVAASKLEDDTTAVPVIIVNWQINDDWKLRVLNGAVLSYDISHNNKVILDLGANYMERSYALDNNGAAIDSQVNVELGCTYRFSETFSVRGFAGIATGRNFELRQNDNELSNEDVDSGAIFGLSATCSF